MSDNAGLKRRRVTERKEKDVTEIKNDENIDDGIRKEDLTMNLETGSYWLTRIVFLRALVSIYFVAFIVALHQNKALIGKHGLLPADLYLNNIKRQVKDNLWDKIKAVPTLLWFFDYDNNVNVLLDRLAYAGLALSSFVFIRGSANIILMLTLWVLYHSIVNVGQTWYSFGWESQILETGFLGAFICPLFSLRKIPKHTPTPNVVLWGLRWLIFRIMLGAGLIKIRGDQCWRDLTCMNYHYETQPVPNPISYFMHLEPESCHKFETTVNHIVELVVPWMLFLTRRFRLVGGSVIIAFMGIIAISGNLSFLNQLTMLPCIACFDDASLAWLFSNRVDGNKHQVWLLQRWTKTEKIKRRPLCSYIRVLFNFSLLGLLVYLSIPIVQNLISRRQVMNTSFDPLRIVNTYGAFGSITKERTEVIFQGTHDHPSDPDAEWLEYEFKCKPGDVKRPPCLITPYHYRLDWLMWFAAFQNYQHNNWLVHLAIKFLLNDKEVTDLIEFNPFKDDEPPSWIRAEHFRYTFTRLDSKEAKKGMWWKRKHIGNYLPPVDLSALREFAKRMGWEVSPQKITKKKQKNK